MTLAVAALGRTSARAPSSAWLGGCLFLGLGVLAEDRASRRSRPLLAPGGRLASRGERALGAALFLGPAALGMAVILVLAPAAVWDNVITYRSTRGYFGLAGMVREFADVDVRFASVTLAAAAVLAGVALAARVRRPLGVGEAVLLAEIALTAGVLWLVEGMDRFSLADARAHYATVFTLALLAAAGTAFLSPLAPSSAPDSVAVPPFRSRADDRRRVRAGVRASVRVLVPSGPRRHLRPAGRRLASSSSVAWVVAAVTYVVEYAFVDYLGAWAAHVFGSADWISEAGQHLKTPHHLVLFSLPLYGVYLVLIAAGMERVMARGGPSTPGATQPGVSPRAP